MRKGIAVALNGPRHGEFFMADHFTFLDGRAGLVCGKILPRRSLAARSPTFCNIYGSDLRTAVRTTPIHKH